MLNEAENNARNEGPANRLVHVLDPALQTCEQVSLLFRLEGFATSFSLDAGSFFAAVGQRQIGAAIINLDIGNSPGLAVARKLRQLHPETVIVMLINRPSVAQTVAAMRLGAFDVLAKPFDNERLLNSVTQALQLSSQMAAINGHPGVVIRGFDQLTAREHEVLEQLSNGRSNREAGMALGISPRTIEVHRARIMTKLRARNTADLLRIVFG